MTEATGLLNRVGESVLGTLPDGPRIAIRRSLRMRKERARLHDADLTVIAHPKSGSTWLRFQLARLYQRKFDLPESMIPRINEYHRLDARVPRLHMAGYEYSKQVIARPAPDSELQQKQAIFIVRHPMDVVVSLYFHIQKHAAHERKLFNNWPLSLEGVSIYDFSMRDDWGLSEAIGFYNQCVRHAETMERAMVVSYEDMRTDTAATLAEIMRFAGTEVTEDEIRETVEFTSVENLRAAERNNSFNSYRLRPGDAKDPDSFKVRRAKIFGYRDYFDPEQLARLDEIVATTLDPSLGYGYAEPDTNPSEEAGS